MLQWMGRANLLWNLAAIPSVVNAIIQVETNDIYSFSANL